VVAWFLFQVVLERCLPCELVQGTPIKGTGERLVYRINAHLAFWTTLLVMQIGFPYWDDQHQVWQLVRAPLELLYQYYAELALVTTLLCFGLSFYLYHSSFWGKDKVLADGGISNNPVYDFFMGRELNPRVGRTFDWKEFCELRPGLIGWMLINVGCMAEQRKQLGYISGSMMLLNIFQGIYVWDAVYQERAILTTMDITTDGFGFMLCFGDMAWVPFTYSVQARYLVKHDPHFSVPALLLILAIHILGYSIFRGANGQKDAFRRDPSSDDVKHLKFLQTKRGTKLLTSGWWGMARKINYTGDYFMGLSWCLTCGFDSIVPYYYAIYFMILLIHRSIRDDHMCQEKYGDDWLTYKKLVPYRFIPGVV
jgi:delta14-sterol reductase/lamin-B receptor